MNEFLSTRVFSDITVFHMLIVAVICVVAGFIKTQVGKHRSVTGSHTSVATCPSCGWAGSVSKYNRHCTKCRTAL